MTERVLDRYLVYVGTYTTGESKGIYLYTMDRSGKLEPTGLVTHADNPTFLAVHPRKRFLYSVNEINRFEGSNHGSVTAYSIEKGTGRLTEINRKSTGGPGPCHLSIDSNGQCILTTNYIGGSICILPIAEDGSLNDATYFMQHEGTSVDPERQIGPHPHSILPDRVARYAFVPDLGLDKIMIYRLNTSAGSLRPNNPPSTTVKPGAGPRHFAFHPNNQYAYVINELNSTITVFAFDESAGRLIELQTLSTLPSDFQGENSCADLHLSQLGQFLYGSNRGHDSIAVFEIDTTNGTLAPIDYVLTQGKTPRNFLIDPTETFLLVANQDTDTVVTFRLDKQSGIPVPTGAVAHIPAPVCLALVPIPLN